MKAPRVLMPKSYTHIIIITINIFVSINFAACKLKEWVIIDHDGLKTIDAKSSSLKYY